MPKLSVVILAKNAGNLISDCIKSVSFADEIIIIDDDSQDNTREIAKNLDARILQDTTQSFAEKRNHGLREAKGEWVLYIDTDERVSEELKKNIQTVIRGASPAKRDRNGKENVVAYVVKRQNFYLGNHPWPKIEKLERLFKKSALKGWYGVLHESPKVDGEIGILHGYLLHYTHRDLTSMLEKTILWSAFEAKLRFDNHHPKMTLWRFPRVMVTAFWDSYIQQQGYKAGTMGLIESIYQAFSIFVTYARLWEFQQKK